jgi:cytochrome c peroxidase
VSLAVQAKGVWDPPAVTVYPDHAKAAHDAEARTAMIAAGELLFKTRFNRLDGGGRPGATGDSKPTPRSGPHATRFSRVAGPDANSCAGCHNQPSVGGSGDAAANVFVGAQFTDPPTVSTEPTVTNERNTTNILGAGAIEMLAREMTSELLTQREAARREAIATSKPVPQRLRAKGVDFGLVIARPDGTFDQRDLEGVDNDLIVKPFGAKGVAVSLREFSIAALNQHHGIQAAERYGWERTGRRDFDEDGVADEFSVGQLSALVMFQASLPALRQDPVITSGVLRGKQLFGQIGCARCHVPFLPLRSPAFSEPNPFNRPGTALPADLGSTIQLSLPADGKGSGVERNLDGTLRVWAYTDLRRHRICDAVDPFFCNEMLRQDNVPTDQFLTAKLWDLAESSPYGHRGDCDTVSEVVLHHAGEAAVARREFERLGDNDKKALISFLLTLGGESHRKALSKISKGGRQ